jgi:PhnB protein
MPSLTTSLYFDGRCQAAFELYERCLGGKIAFLVKWGDSPMASEVPPDWHDKVLYARFALGASELLGADVPPGGYRPPQGFGVMLEFNDTAEAQRVFNGLAANGVVRMPLRETFWAALYGGLVDEFGVPWELNCGRPQ